MYTPLKYLLLSSAILTMFPSMASTIPELNIPPEIPRVVIDPNSNTALDFTASNNMNAGSTLTNVIPLSAGGQYDDGTSTFQPMLVISTDGGNSWSYKVEKAVNLPAEYNDDGFFSSVHCSGAICIAGGQYYDRSRTYQPMLAISADAGNTWSYKIEKAINLPTDYKSDGYFSSLNCSGAVCIAGGQYYDGSTSLPMLAISNDGGNTWSYKVEKAVNLPANHNNFGKFTGVHCSGTVCIAGGLYRDESITLPMLAISADGGNTWSYKVEKAINLPADYDGNGYFSSVNCSNAVCIAGGQYYDSSSTAQPMLATSTDGGNTWSYKVEKAVNLPAGYKGDGYFSSVNCSGAICIAGGHYYDGSTYQPMLAMSADGGDTWSYEVEKAVNLPANYNNSGKFTSVNCSSTVCIAGGQYYDSNRTYQPMLTISTDGGHTWSYKVEKALNLPADYNNFGRFSSVNCSGAVCIAAGKYDDGSTSLPMLTISTDEGNTWSYKVEKAVHLPADYKSEGHFTSVNSIGAGILSDSLRFINAPSYDANTSIARQYTKTPWK